MEIETSVIHYIAKTFYDLSPDEDSIVPLCGYTDKNFTFTIKNVDKYVLKIVHESESVEGLVEIIDEIIGSAYDYDNSLFIIPKPIKTTTGNRYSAMATIRTKDSNTCDSKDLLCNIKLSSFYPSVTMIELVNDCQDYYSNERLYNQSGEFCYELCRFFRKNCHLSEQLKRKRTETSFSWSLMDSPKRIKSLSDKFYPNKNHERRILIDKTMNEVNSVYEVLNNKLSKYIIHGDLSGKNILVNLENYLEKSKKNLIEKFCLIDFQDIQVAPQIVELSILILYNILEQKNLDFEDALLLIGRWTLQGFQRGNGKKLTLIQDEELILIPLLMRFRLCQSLLNGLEAHEGNPSNDYVMNTNVRGWYLLKLLTPTDGADDETTIYNDSKKLLNCWVSPESEFSSFKRDLLVK